ncbi:hypothetical protein KKF55_00200 [Patescibacteria group bacterium]|nr:hypothetical protein [Patescibacteria group bacterium]
MEQFSKYNVGSRNVKKKSSSLVGLYILLILILSTLVLVVVKLFFPSDLLPEEIQKITNQNYYKWQDSCDSRCAEMLGKANMSKIDSSGCTDMNLEIEMGFVIDKNQLAAMNDKSNSIGCFDYNWLKTCDIECAKIVGSYSLSLLDAESDCEKLSATGQSRKQFSFASDKTKDDAYFKALNDRLESSQCRVRFKQ